MPLFWSNQKHFEFLVTKGLFTQNGILFIIPQMFENFTESAN